jgi:hypothetical protein
MARKKKRQRQNGRAIQKGWYEDKVAGVPGGFIKHTNPQRKKLSNLV